MSFVLLRRVWRKHKQLPVWGVLHLHLRGTNWSPHTRHSTPRSIFTLLCGAWEAIFLHKSWYLLQVVWSQGKPSAVFQSTEEDARQIFIITIITSIIITIIITIIIYLYAIRQSSVDSTLTSAQSPANFLSLADAKVAQLLSPFKTRLFQETRTTLPQCTSVWSTVVVQRCRQRTE